MYVTSYVLAVIIALYVSDSGLIYLPEIKYRRILNRAFGPGGWALMPRGETLHFQVSSTWVCVLCCVFL